MAERNLDAFCAGLLDDIAEASRCRTIYEHSGCGKSALSARTLRRPPITTYGYVPSDRAAFVYAAGPKDGLVKVGMSSNLRQRMKDLRAVLIFAHPVKPSIAKAVETEALRRLGHRVGDGEWVTASPEDVVQAIRQAAVSVQHVMRNVLTNA